MLQKNWNVCSCLTEQPSVLDDAEELPGLNHLLGMSVFLLFAGFFVLILYLLITSVA